MKQTYTNSLRERREVAGLSQIELVVKSGVGLSTINKLENHPLPTGLLTAQRLAAALGCQVADLFPYLAEGGIHERN